MKMEQYKTVLDGAVVSDATTRKVLRMMQTVKPASRKAKRRHGYAIAAATCVVALLLISLPLLFGKWPLSPKAPGSVSTTTSAPPTASTTEPPNGTGGDENACTIHQFHYHAIDGNLIEYVGQEKMNAFIEEYQGKGEDANIITFVNYCGLTREEFIQVMEWADILDQTADQQSIVIGATAPYTYREFVDAIFGDDAALTERIFSAGIFDQQIRDNK